MRINTKTSIFFPKILFLLSFVFIVNVGFGQIWQPDGLRMPGDWNAWVNTHGMGGNFDLTKISSGTVRWHTTFQYTGTTGSQTFKFVSGNGDPWNNQWADNSSVSLDAVSNVNHPPSANNSISVTNSKYYTVNWKDSGYINTSCVFMETSAFPVTLSSLSFSPASPMPYQTVGVTLTASASLCAEEKVFLRYTTDAYANSELIEVSFVGTAGSVTIPALPAASNVSFYVFSTTLTAANIGTNYDMFSINVLNNSGSNYTYTVQTPTAYTTAQNGNFSASATWVGGIVPVSGMKIIVNHDLIINQNFTASELLVNTGGKFIFEASNNRELTLASNGTWTNDGTVVFNDGLLIINDYVQLKGTQITSYNDLTIQGVDIVFTYIKSQVTGTMNLTGGSISTAPEMMSGSTLKYSQGGDYNRVTEWNNPYNVVISNNTNLKLNIDSWGSDLTVQENLTIDLGSTADMESTTNKLIVEGDINIDGELILSTSMGGDMEIQGDWNRSGTFTPNSRQVSFNASSGIQNHNNHTTFDYIKVDNVGSEMIMNAGITVAQAMYVENIAVLDININLIDGAGSFELITAGEIQIGNVLGITSSGATGNIQVAGTRTFSTSGKYHFIAAANQIPGNGMPASVGDIIVDLSGANTLSFSSSYTVSNQLVLNNGSLDIGTYNLIIDNSSASSVLAGVANAGFVNSYVIGSLKRKLSAASGFYFPIGTSSNLQLARLDFNSVTSGSSPYVSCSYTTDATLTDISALGLLVDGTPVTDRLDNGYWNFSPENISSFSADVILDARNYSNGSTNPKAHALIKRSGGDWFLPNGTHDNATQSVSGGVTSVQRSSVTAFSDYAIAYNKDNGTLPVELISFEAVKINDSKTVDLIWITASEINSDYFELQRSVDAERFETIGLIDAAGNSTASVNYSYTDFYSGKVIYYRLKQVDFDNTINFSKIISITSDNLVEDPYVSVFYRDGNMVFETKNLREEEYQYVVYNSMGQVVLTNDLNCDGNLYYTIPLKLTQGMYFVQILNSTKFENMNFVVR